jgi:hypothetical protein
MNLGVGGRTQTFRQKHIVCPVDAGSMLSGRDMTRNKMNEVPGLVKLKI